MKFDLSKKMVLKLVLLVYVVVSAVYILSVEWTSLKTWYGEKSFQSGFESCVDQLISEAGNSGCATFSVYNEELSVDLVNASCVGTGTVAVN